MRKYKKYEKKRRHTASQLKKMSDWVPDEPVAQVLSEELKILARCRASAAEHALFLYLKFFCNPTTGKLNDVDLSANTISEHLGINPASVYKAMASLGEYGLLDAGKKVTILIGKFRKLPSDCSD